jgi:hypothetical protein
MGFTPEEMQAARDLGPGPGHILGLYKQYQTETSQGGFLLDLILLTFYHTS